MWLTSGESVMTEITAQAGFDWCLIDAEHGVNTATTIRTQLQIMQGLPTQPVLRVPTSEDWLIKQALDLGVQSLLLPMIHTGEMARKAVAATRYPPAGVRGVGAAIARASGYNAVADYTATAQDQLCVMLQAESREALDNIDDIAATDGADVIFIGPADLSADMGYLENPNAPAVTEAIEHMIARIRAAGKVAGIITLDEDAFPYYRNLDVGFIGVGADVLSYAAAVRSLAERSKAAFKG
ncbi:UNVERIFIED_CONTAM: hypothetical protein GTU68_055549 [Idotea baltica]|nr:hypothetical protein [Idotea baltica]